MQVVNEAKQAIHEWGEAFLPLVSKGCGRVIVEGYRDMKRDGIQFPVSSSSPSWVPAITMSPATPRRDDAFDVKEFYRRVKKLKTELETSGSQVFQQKLASAIAADCIQYLPRIRRMERDPSNDEDTTSHLRKLARYMESITENYARYREKEREDAWSVDEEASWSEDPPVQPQDSQQLENAFDSFVLF